MARYAARVLTAGGSKELLIEARDDKDAKRRASASGRVLDVKRKRTFTGRGLSFGDRQVFMSRLAAMLASGVGAGEALRLIYTTFSGRIKAVSHELLLKVEAGASLAEAVEQVGAPSFPEEVAAMIKAGSFSGTTAKALRDAMDFEREIAHVRKNSAKGLWSAITGFLTAGLLILGTVFWMLPQLMSSDMVKMLGDAAYMESMVRASNWAGYVMIVILIIGVIMFLLGTVGRQVAPVHVDKLILKIPLYKDFTLARSNYIAFYALGTLVGTGVRMEQAFDLMAKITPPGGLRKDFQNAAAAVRNGKPWAAVMRTLHATDRAALVSSLDRSQVSNAFAAMSDSYRTLYATRTEALVILLQTLSMIFLTLSGIIVYMTTIHPMLVMTSKMMTG